MFGVYNTTTAATTSSSIYSVAQLLRKKKNSLTEFTAWLQQHQSNSYHLCLEDDDEVIINDDTNIDMNMLSTVKEDLENWKHAIRSNQFIKDADIWIQTDRAPQQNSAAFIINIYIYAIVLALAELPNLESIQIRGYCHAMPLSVLTKLLEKAPKLQTFNLTSVKLQVSSEQDLQELSRALAQASPNLEQVNWQDIQLHLHEIPSEENNSSAFLDAVFLGLAHTPNLKSLLLSPAKVDVLGTLSPQPLAKLLESATLEKLVLSSLKAPHNQLVQEEDIDKNILLFQTISQVLSQKNKHKNKSNLKILHVPFRNTPSYCNYVSDILIHNTTLEEMTLLCYQNEGLPTIIQQPQSQSMPLLQIAKALVKTRIPKFHMVGPEATRISDPNILQAFAFAPEVNYHLQQVTLFRLVQNHHFAPQLQYQCHLNQQGRQRWIEHQYNTTPATATSMKCPVSFLSQVSKDLDGLYYYLSCVNPSLLMHATQRVREQQLQDQQQL